MCWWLRGCPCSREMRHGVERTISESNNEGVFAWDIFYTDHRGERGGADGQMLGVKGDSA